MANKRGSGLPRAGKSSGISRAFLEHQSAIKRFLSRFLSGFHDIEDLAQETYLRAFKAEQNQEVRSPKAFLFRIAKNIALNELSRKSRLLTDYIEDSVSSDVIGVEASPEQRAAEQQKLAVFCQAVAVLPAQCRRAFLLRKVYGLSHKEIAAELNISVSTVEKHVAQGLMRCSAYLREAGHAVENVARLPTEPKQRDAGSRRDG
jgi:RNA polymerase sigma-70 factor (ECF subfamily)